MISKKKTIVSSPIRAHLALFTVALIYGANYTIAKVVLDDGYLLPRGFVLLRVISGLVLFHIVHAIFIREKVERTDFMQLFWCGIFGVVINQVCFFSGLKYTTPINASLIMTTTPILVLLISSFVLKEKITSRKILGIIIGAAGAILLMVYGRSINYQSSQIIGDVLILINALSYGYYLVLVKKLSEKYHPITVVKWAFTFGILFVFPLGIGELLQANWSNFNIRIWGAIAYVLICTTFLTYLLNAYALSKVNASLVSFYVYLQPFFATSIALVLGVDQLNSYKIFAASCIFTGVYLVSSRLKG